MSDPLEDQMGFGGEVAPQKKHVKAIRLGEGIQEGPWGMEASDPKYGVPLTIQETHDDTVDLADNNDALLTVPRAWFPENIDIDNIAALGHKALNAPPGELEKLFQKEYEKAAQYQAEQSKTDPTFTTANSPFGSGKSTILDDWMKAYGAQAGNTGRLSDVDRGAFVPARPAALPVGGANNWQPQVPEPPKGFRPRKASEIPADAGTGWGNADQKWNPKTKKWVSGKAAKGLTDAEDMMLGWKR